MSLKVVKEVELAAAASPSVQPVPASKPAIPAEPKSENSFDPSLALHSLEIIGEVRKILNARASVIVALMASAALTFLAMEKATGMALAIAASFDLGVFLPLAYIAYLRRKE